MFVDRILKRASMAQLSESDQLDIEMIKRSVVFSVDNVAEYVITVSDQEYWDLMQDFPNIAPPYPVMWFEHVVPQIFNSKTSGLHTEQHGFKKFGLLVMSIPGIKLGEGKWLSHIHLFIETKEEVIAKSPVECSIGINSDGSPTGLFTLEVEKKNEEWLKRNKITSLIMEIAPTLLAICFMHCKNVTIKTNNPIRKCNHTQHAPMVSYNTIDIEPMKKVLKHNGKSEVTGIRKALHICRGHFKDYRDNAGLGRGHAKGIYWWSQHIRGSAKFGTVISDYEVNV
jgi:hypothetical protein